MTPPARSCVAAVPISWYIAWKSRITGYRGHGQPIFDTKASCNVVCDRLNVEIPEICHWPEEEVP